MFLRKDKCTGQAIKAQSSFFFFSWQDLPCPFLVLLVSQLPISRARLRGCSFSGVFIDSDHMNVLIRNDVKERRRTMSDLESSDQRPHSPPKPKHASAA